MSSHLPDVVEAEADSLSWELLLGAGGRLQSYSVGELTGLFCSLVVSKYLPATMRFGASRPRG